MRGREAPKAHAPAREIPGALEAGAVPDLALPLPAAAAALAAVAHELRTPLQAFAIVSESLVEVEQPLGRRRQDRLVQVVQHDVA